MENLSEELAQLDQGNIHSLMGSETQIRELMTDLDQAILEIEQMEMKLTVYDELLSGVRVMMQKMGQQYSSILVENKNLRALHTEVEDLVVRGRGKNGMERGVRRKRRGEGRHGRGEEEGGKRKEGRGRRSRKEGGGRKR